MATLIDTNMLSQPLKPKPHEGALGWMLSVPREDVYLSVISIQETRAGLDLLNAGEKRERLEKWFRRVRRRYTGRVLPVTEEIAEASGHLVAQVRRAKLGFDPNDILIAATAKVHGLKLATLNVRHFSGLGVELIEF